MITKGHILWGGVGIGFGLSLGIGAATLVGRWSGGETARGRFTTSTVAAESEPARVVHTRTIVERVADEKSSDETDDEVAQAAPESTQEDLRAEFESDIATHESDWRDPSWAPSAEKNLTEQFGSTPGTHKILGVDCRSTSCVVNVEWPSLAEASRGYTALLHQPTEPNCASKILLRPAEGDGRYTEQLVLDCTEARAN